MGLEWALALALAFTCLTATMALRAELRLEEPREVLRTEGGRVEAWSNNRVLRDADIIAARITIGQRGLVLPKYSDAARIAYVEEGEGYAGILSGYSLGEASGVRRVRRGDIVALPRGVASWWYNSGSGELRILALAETSESESEGESRGFFLIGGGRQGSEEEGSRQEHRGILHGFRGEFLADAWDLDERQVEDLLNRQQGVAIVVVDRDVRIPEESNPVQGGQRESQTHLREHIASGEFVYNIREGSAEVRVRDAGVFNSANRFKLPILRNLNLGATFGRLERDAILAPQWNVNGHAVLHILRGNGELEIVGNDGERLVSQEVREGEGYAVPRFYAHGIKAGDESLEWVAFHTTDQPFVEALAGRTSVYKSLPEEVAAAAFNVDVEQIRQVRERRERDAILLPGRGRRSQQVLHPLCQVNQRDSQTRPVLQDLLGTKFR